ncbi:MULTISPECIES: TIGR02234 family membrane protein [unclassified Modestobacter]
MSSTVGPGTGARRELTLAVLGSALAGGLALSAAGQPWADVTVVREPPLPPTTEVLTGGEVVPLVAACGLLLLAAALALIAVRGAGRWVVGVLVAGAGGVLGWSGVQGLTGRFGVDAGDVGASVGLGSAQVSSEVVAGWPALTLAAGVLAVLVGTLVVLRGRTWPGMGRRYERTAAAPAARPSPARPARPATDEDRHQAAWKALDRGEDPTV